MYISEISNTTIFTYKNNNNHILRYLCGMAFVLQEIKKSFFLLKDRPKSLKHSQNIWTLL